MAFFNEAWFIHQLNDTLVQLAQQKIQKTAGSYRVKMGVVGKTYPFNRIGPVSMSPLARDADTTYINPPSSKRRAVLADQGAAVLIDELDQLKTIVNLDSEHSMNLVNARNRALDDIVLAASLAAALNVDEAAETTSSSALPGGQQIANGGTGLTLAKVLSAAEIMNGQDVDLDDRYFFYSAHAMTNLLNNTAVTSSDFNTIQALARGGFPMDQSWMGFRWRMSTRLPKAGNIRSCIAWQKNAIGGALAAVTEQDVRVMDAPHKWGNQQCIIKLSAGGVRIDDAGVVQIDIDETQ